MLPGSMWGCGEIGRRTSFGSWPVTGLRVQVPPPPPQQQSSIHSIPQQLQNLHSKEIYT
jgi:hypothetical protein